VFFNSVEQILAKIVQQPGWEKYREYLQLLECWQKTVNQNTAKHTRPLHLTRQVLWVATSSAARAQELSFQRYALVKKLNSQLPFTIKDIHFSSSQWHQKVNHASSETTLFTAKKTLESKISLNSPQPLDELVNNNPEALKESLSSPTEAQAAAQHWLKVNQQRADSCLPCPDCASSTPSAEIERWGLCYHCIAKKWSTEYRPPTFPERK